MLQRWVVPASIEAEIDRVRSPGLDALRESWQAAFGRSPASALSKDIMGRMIAWRIQEQAFGGLDRVTLKFLDGLARRDGSASGERRLFIPKTSASCRCSRHSPAGLSERCCASNWRAAAREPSDMHMTIASPSSGERPSRFRISVFSSILIPRAVSSQRGAARSALIDASRGRAIAEPNSWLGSSFLAQAPPALGTLVVEFQAAFAGGGTGRVDAVERHDRYAVAFMVVASRTMSLDRPLSNRSLSVVEPVSASRKRKLEKRKQRRAPKKRRLGTVSARFPRRRLP
jgi:DUF2924 family protein